MGTKWKKQEGSLLLDFFRMKTSRWHLGVFLSPSPCPLVSLLSNKLSAFDHRGRNPGIDLRRFLRVSIAMTLLGCRVMATPAAMSSLCWPSASSVQVPAGTPVREPCHPPSEETAVADTPSMRGRSHDLNLIFLSICDSLFKVLNTSSCYNFIVVL